MPEQDLLAADYLRPPRHAVWSWSLDGDTIEHIQGTTIAFRAEVVGILRRLAEGGLPPFDSLVLVLAACRANWSTRRSIVRDELAEPRTAFMTQAVDDLLTRLDKVSRFSEEVRGPTVAKQELLAAIFERYPRRASKEASWQIVASLVAGLECGEVGRREFADRPAQRVVELRQLCDALDRIDEKSLRLRMQTGLDQLLREPPDEEQAEPARRQLTVHELLVELVRDPEHAGLVRLVRNLLAVTYLPRRIDEPVEIAMGGVSDIANRGEYDRLLLSELANDDDVLMTRLALNEALYLRRETPPSNPSQTRLVLVDCGLRMWGLPRLYATGVALSLAAQRSFTGETLLMRAEGESIVPVDTTSTQGLTEHLSVLRPEPHAGLALESFAKMAKELTAEAVLVTCDDAWRDGEFRRHLRLLPLEELFVFTVSRNGTLRAFRHTLAGEKPIREATLDLESLLAPPAQEPQKPAPLPLRERRDPQEMPAFLRQNPSPLFIPHPIDWKNAWYDQEQGLFCVSTYRQLTWWPHVNHGPVQCYPNLPADRLYWVGQVGEPVQSRFVVGDARGNRFWISIDRDFAGSIPIPDVEELQGLEHKVLGVAHHRDVLFVIGQRQVTEYAIASARKIASWTLPAGYKWTGHGRYFRKGWDLCALASGSTLEPVCSRTLNFAPGVHRQVRARWTAVDGDTGPVAVETRGKLIVSTGDGMQPLPAEMVGDIASITVDRQTTRMLVSTRHTDPTQIRHLLVSGRQEDAPTRFVEIDGSLRRTVELGGSDFRPQEVSLRKNVVAAAVNADGRLYLGTKRGLVLCLNEYLFLQRLPSQAMDGQSKGQRRFERVPAAWDRGFTLSVATWPDGSSIYLDGRGLLHLVSSDAKLPQVTIVLSHWSAGWSSDGRYWGHPYFSGERPKAPPEEIWTQVVQPLLARMKP